MSVAYWAHQTNDSNVYSPLLCNSEIRIPPHRSSYTSYLFRLIRITNVLAVAHQHGAVGSVAE